jgi:hypothetical protein
MRRVTPLAALVLLGCASNPYGYAPEYAPLSAEEPYFEQGRAAGYEEVRRDPAGYSEPLVAWFGVVQRVEPIAGSGKTLVSMQLHFHQARHLCADQFDSSCRVTISERQGGPFSARIALRPEDQGGRDRVYAGSLLKVYGKVAPDYDQDGGPILEAEYYRHWPRGTYVTTSRRGNMRR